VDDTAPEGRQVNSKPALRDAAPEPQRGDRESSFHLRAPIQILALQSCWFPKVSARCSSVRSSFKMIFRLVIQNKVKLEIKLTELLDATLATLHKVSYLVKAGHDEEHPVTSDSVIPAGICFHKFIYSDGSFDLIPAIR
jgi:hypothetical protein